MITIFQAAPAVDYIGYPEQYWYHFIFRENGALGRSVGEKNWKSLDDDDWNRDIDTNFELVLIYE
jgi:hypothetical protein